MEIKGVCRCCLTEGLHKDMNQAYTFLDKKEIYSKMLLECFNLVMTPAPNSVNIICNNCIESLRTCVNFKKQVERSDQEYFRKFLKQNDCTLDEIKIKIEQEDDFTDSDDYFLSDAVTEQKIKLENESSEKDGERTSKKQNIEKSDLKTLISKLASVNCKIEPVKTSNLKEKSIKFKWKGHEELKYKNNLTNILKYSNVVPFKNKSLLGFECIYCNSTFQDPSDLRSHNTTHENQRLSLTERCCKEACVKVDITNLACAICDKKLENLNQLKNHLVVDHKKVFHDDVKDNTMQFLLKKGENTCSMCTSSYETFKMLKQHMNTHYCNYACNECNTTFATKRSLLAHKKTHSNGTYKCDYCDKIFSSKYKKCYHVKKLHLGERSIANCPHCDQRFRSYYQRNQHLKVHNLQPKYQCNVCDREFLLKSLLMSHIKKNHLMEKNAQCNECGYRFFSKKALKAHMVKHSGERNYSCEICHKAYARKYTLREHMRIHNNDRRFRCDVCGTAFVQKCSLKSHLLSNHGISLAANEISSTE